VGLRAGHPGEAVDEVGIVLLLEADPELGPQRLEAGPDRLRAARLPHRLEEVGQVGPDGGVVQRVQGDAEHVGVGDGHQLALRVGDLDGLARQPVGQPVEAPLGVALGEGAVLPTGVAQAQELLQGGEAPLALRSRVEKGSRRAWSPRPVDQAMGSRTPSTTRALTLTGNRLAQVVPRYEP